MRSVYCIAEIGSNHNGSLEKAKELISLAKRAGADAAKFQSFSAETLLNCDRFVEGRWERDPAWEAIRAVELPKEWHAELACCCGKLGIDFLSTPFDEERLGWLLTLDVPAIKIASGDLTHFALLTSVAAAKKPLFLSTGHATLQEIEEAVALLRAKGCQEIVLMHCVSSYPTAIEESNLRAIETLAKHFELPIGFSDHSPGYLAAVGAVALGATVIEKHFTDDRHQQGSDHLFAMEPEEFAEMVSQIRLLEQALGDGEKRPLDSEKSERVDARRALYTSVPIAQGERIVREKIKVVRRAYPTAIPAGQLKEALGKRAGRPLAANRFIRWEDLIL